MKFYKWYAPTPESAKIESDKENFAKNLVFLKKDWVEFLQFFNGNDIDKYHTIVVSWWHALEKRVDEVEKIYRISPYEIRIKGDEKHFIYAFDTPCANNTYLKIKDAVSELFGSSCQDYTFYETSCDNIISNKWNVYPLQKFLFVNELISGNSVVAQDAVNGIIINEINKLPITDIIEKIWGSYTVDPFLNVSIEYGKPFDTVLSSMKSIDSTFKFFNEHYSSGFVLKDIGLASYLADGVSWSMKGIMEYQGGYAKESKWNIEIITDFTIRVHYKYIYQNDVSYVVSLISNTGEKANHIIWKNSVSENYVIEQIQKLGSFHFFKPKKEYIIGMHTMISSIDVPNITVMDSYGRNTFKWRDLLILKNGVFDIDKKQWFPKDDDSEFYFLDSIDGFCLKVDGSAKIEDIIWDMCPTVERQEINKAKDFLDIFTPLYKDQTGYMLYMSACAILGYALYSWDTEFPLFCAYGGTGSGKTTYGSFLSKMLGIRAKPMTFEAGTTFFAMTKKMAHLSKLPLMCSEYRNNANGVSEKLAVFRSLYDRTNAVKWRADQTLVTYQFKSTFFMEWEEMPQDGAVRTRFIHKMLSKRFRSDGINIQSTVDEKKDLIQSFLYSYMMTSTKKAYLEAIDEWESLFRDSKTEPRLIHNVIMLYAGVVAFDKSMKDIIIPILKDLLKVQQEDFAMNGTGQQIIKALTRYLWSKNPRMFFDRDRFIFSWSDAVAYFESYKVALTLWIDAYRDHLINLWFEEWFFECEEVDQFGNKDDVMVDWFAIHMSKCPKEFMTRKEIFHYYKEYAKKWKAK